MLTPLPRKRGWCPSLHEPMQSGDGWLVRVKPPAARLTPEAATALAAAAAEHGNGIIELTQRGNLQIRGLAPHTTARFAAAIVAAGLGRPDPAQERRRAILPPPLLGDDPGLAPDAAALTARLEHAAATDPRLAHLPAKFAIAIEAGGILANRPVAADLVAWTDGRSAGLRLADRGTAPAPVGLLPYPGTKHGAFGVAPPFGQLDAPLLRHLAAVAARFGADLRITPWRAILLGRIRQADAARIAAAIGPDCIVDPADPRLLVTACIGRPGCASASVSPRTDAARLRPAQPIHVSGCAKGCAHPGPAPLTLVGNAGRYDLVRHGRAADPPCATGLSILDISHVIPGPA